MVDIVLYSPPLLSLGLNGENKLVYFCDQPKGIPKGSTIFVSNGHIRKHIDLVCGDLKDVYQVDENRYWESDCVQKFSRSSDPIIFNAITKFESVLSKKTASVDSLTFVVETLRDILYKEEVCVVYNENRGFLSKVRSNLDLTYPEWQGPIYTGQKPHISSGLSQLEEAILSCI
jgi:hypothetical protein